MGPTPNAGQRLPGVRALCYRPGAFRIRPGDYQMTASMRGAEASGRSMAIKVRRLVPSRRSGALVFISIAVFPALAGCSSSFSSDSPSPAHQAIADLFGSAPRTAPAPAVAMPPPSNVPPATAAAVSPTSAANAPVPQGTPATYATGAPVPPAAPATYAASAPVSAAAPSSDTPSASVGPPVAPQESPAANAFLFFYNSLKDDKEDCSMPSEPCDNSHRVSN